MSSQEARPDKPAAHEQKPLIAALVPYPVYPAKMGGQKGIALFYQYLSERLPVTVISTRNNAFPQNSPIRFEPMLGNSRWRYLNPAYFFRLRKWLIREKITHLVLEHPYYGWLGTLISLTTKIKLVVHSHNIEGLRFKSTGKWWWGILWHYEKWTHRMAGHSFFVTDEDRDYAIRFFKLSGKRTHCITYGIDIHQPPAATDRLMARKILEQRHGIDPDERILLFNGTLSYGPNRDALRHIIQDIAPLLSDNGLRYRVLVCGKDLPAEFLQHAKGDKLADRISYAGFVEDINTYFLGSDIFLNPVNDGGGIKTKLVEALGLNLSVVSTRNGAIGVPQSLVNQKMKLVDNNDWEAFCKAICQSNPAENTPAVFYNHFYWGNIADKAADILRNK